MIEDAAAYGGDNQEDARFALVLLYNREKRYDEALTQLERCCATVTRATGWSGSSGSTALRAGRAGRRRAIPRATA